MVTTDERFQCDGSPTCPNAPTHTHRGSRAYGEVNRYYCDACCSLATCPEALSATRLASRPTPSC
jgi:hypothetical protein